MCVEGTLLTALGYFVAEGRRWRRGLGAVSAPSSVTVSLDKVKGQGQCLLCVPMSSTGPSAQVHTGISSSMVSCGSAGPVSGLSGGLWTGLEGATLSCGPGHGGQGCTPRALGTVGKLSPEEWLGQARGDP